MWIVKKVCRGRISAIVSTSLRGCLLVAGNVADVTIYPSLVPYRCPGAALPLASPSLAGAFPVPCRCLPRPLPLPRRWLPRPLPLPPPSLAAASPVPCRWLPRPLPLPSPSLAGALPLPCRCLAAALPVPCQRYQTQSLADCWILLLFGRFCLLLCWPTPLLPLDGNFPWAFSSHLSLIICILFAYGQQWSGEADDPQISPFLNIFSKTLLFPFDFIFFPSSSSSSSLPPLFPSVCICSALSNKRERKREKRNMCCRPFQFLFLFSFSFFSRIYDSAQVELI